MKSQWWFACFSTSFFFLLRLRCQEFKILNSNILPTYLRPRKRDRFRRLPNGISSSYMQIRSKIRGQRHQRRWRQQQFEPKINAVKFTVIVCAEKRQIFLVRRWNVDSVSLSHSLSHAFFFSHFLPLTCLSRVYSIKFFRFYCRASDIVTQPKRLHLLFSTYENEISE